MLLQTDYPFSSAFGLADTRQNSVKSTARVFEGLLRRQSEKNVLEFSTLSDIVVNSDGSIDREKLKKLVKVLRPNKDKQLTLVDFTRSVDNVYRELKTLSAGIRNAAASKSILVCDGVGVRIHTHVKLTACHSFFCSRPRLRIDSELCVLHRSRLHRIVYHTGH